MFFSGPFSCVCLPNLFFSTPLLSRYRHPLTVWLVKLVNGRPPATFCIPARAGNVSIRPKNALFTFVQLKMHARAEIHRNTPHFERCCISLCFGEHKYTCFGLLRCVFDFGCSNTIHAFRRFLFAGVSGY